MSNRYRARPRSRTEARNLLKAYSVLEWDQGVFHTSPQLVRRWRTLRRAQMSSTKERPNV
jgi:hypothetical protein